ncbi:MAG: hypothetical protein WBH31_12720 [Promethearchaeia archaeon]
MKELQKEVPENIESGEFAKEWEGKLSKIKFKLYKFFRTKIPFAKLEKKARKNLNLPIGDLFEDITKISNLYTFFNKFFL